MLWPNVLLTSNLDEGVASLNMELKCVLDTLASEKECTTMLRTKCPWYNSETKDAKRMPWKLEKKFIKYKLPSLWQAYKAARNRYYGLLNAKKRNTLKTKIKDCATDSWQLHKLISNLMSEQANTKWPPHKDIQSLANDFADYFETKMLKIREMFKTTQPMCVRCQTPPNSLDLLPWLKMKSGRW